MASGAVVVPQLLSAPLRPHGSFEMSTSKENSAFFSLKSLYVSSSSSRYVREPMFFE